VTVDQFFAGHDESRRLFDRVREVVTSVGPARVRVTKSQVAFRRRTGFAFVWMPGQYLGATEAPLVLTVGLRRRDDSPRWKQVVEPSPGRFTHHLELRAESEVDAEVRAWLVEAWETAG
jgi:hypothetical protein